MQTAFIVKLDIDDVSSSNLATIADDIEDELLASGFDVISVAAWSRSEAAAPASLLSGDPAIDLADAFSNLLGASAPLTQQTNQIIPTNEYE